MNTVKLKPILAKENNEMEEVMGVKVKKPEVAPVVDEEPVEEVQEEVVDQETDEEEYTQYTPTEDVIAPTEPEEVADDGVPYKKVATARLIDSTGATIYRFDITHKEYGKDSGVIELKNIVNNFDAIRPTTAKGYKEYFMLLGIINFNFPTTVMSYSQNILATLTQLESLINQHITIAGFKRDTFKFYVDTVVEE